MITNFTPDELATLEGFTGWEEFYKERPMPTLIKDGHYWDCFTVDMLLRDRIASEFTFFNELGDMMRETMALSDSINARRDKGEEISEDEEVAIMQPLWTRNQAYFASNPPVDYGVCDTPEQVLERWPSLETDPRRFIILFGEIRKDEQPEHGGWRWHKWGEYIGTKDPQWEYLADEEGIDSVLIFKVLQMKP